MPRRFSHLTRQQIAEIVQRSNDGESHTSLAAHFQVDRTTITYHLRKYDLAFPEQGGVYAVIKANAQRECVHPSSRCTLCHLMQDELMRGERDTIRLLTQRLAAAEHRLRRAGLPVE